MGPLMSCLYPCRACLTTQMHIFQEQVVPGSPDFRLGVREALGRELEAAGMSSTAGQGGTASSILGSVGSLASSQLLLTAQSHGLTATVTFKGTKN